MLGSLETFNREVENVPPYLEEPEFEILSQVGVSQVVFFLGNCTAFKDFYLQEFGSFNMEFCFISQKL